MRTIQSLNFIVGTKIYIPPLLINVLYKLSLSHLCDWIRWSLLIQISILLHVVITPMFLCHLGPTTLYHKMDLHAEFLIFYQLILFSRLFLFLEKAHRECKIFFNLLLLRCLNDQRLLCNISMDSHFHISLLFHRKNHKP